MSSLRQGRRSPVGTEVAGGLITARSGALPARAPSAQPLRQLRLDGFAPDLVALRLRMEVVGAERIGQEDALVVEKFRPDVEEEDVLLVVQLRDDAIDIDDFLPHRIARD